MLRFVSKILEILEIPVNLLQKWIGVKGMPYFFLLPNLAFFGVFVVIPLAINFFYSFTGGVEFYPAHRTFVGTDQYEALLDCESYAEPDSCNEDRFWIAAYNTGFYAFFQVFFMTFFSLVTALVLNMRIRFKGFFRSVFFYPVLLSPVVVGLIWKWILLRDGLLNTFLTWIGEEKILFLVEPFWGNFWAVFVSVWAHMGFYTLILLAGLQAIPRDIYEAAEMDRTGKFKVLRRITIPLLLPNLIVVLILTLIRAVQVFDEVYVLTGGGPGTSTLFMIQYIYETGFKGEIQNFGLASAASIFLGLVLMVFTLAQLYFARRKEKNS